MAWRRSVVYAAVLHDGSVQFRYSPRPAMDAAWWRTQGARQMIPLHPPLPPAWADIACRHLQVQVDATSRPAPRLPWRRPSRRMDIRRFVARTRRYLGMIGHRWLGYVQPAVDLYPQSSLPKSYSQRYVSPSYSHLPTDPGHWPGENDLDGLLSLLDGRLLGELEIVQLTERAGVELQCSVEDCLTALTLLRRLHRRPGVQRTDFGAWRCGRCGATEDLVPWDCAACGDSECRLCEQCRGPGVVRACTLLYAARAAPSDLQSSRPTTERIKFQSPTLTPAQSRASKRLEQFVAKDPQREALVWAVCGAGKTELCFPAVARVLGQGGRVLFAIPRRDVVRELGQRLKTAFADVAVQVLHGGSDRTELWTLGPGSLTVATTHQVLRFEQAFDLVILDEVDAFPYRGSRMLHDAVANAVRSGGRIVRMSATPGRRLIERARGGHNVLITVPVRHHGQPLPVPKLLRDASLLQSNRAFRPSAVLRAVLEESLSSEKPTRVLLFVPDVASTERVGRALARYVSGRTEDGPGIRSRVLWSHARDPEREAKIRALQQGSCAIFVATSILERGVTVPDVDVIVLFADNERVFTESTLVQMAGRVGRTVARPTGRVHFIGARIGSAMRHAVQQIERHNDEAARLGLLRGPLPAESRAGLGAKSDGGIRHGVTKRR